MLDFCLWPKKWEIQNFFEIVYHSPTALGAFLNHASQKILLSIEIEPLVVDVQCWWSYLMLFREEDIFDLESCTGVTLNFLKFFVIGCL